MIVKEIKDKKSLFKYVDEMDDKTIEELKSVIALREAKHTLKKAIIDEVPFVRIHPTLTKILKHGGRTFLTKFKETKAAAAYRDYITSYLVKHS